MLTSNTYSIEVTTDIATKIRIMAEAGVFNLKRGKATLNFDNDGNLSSVETHLFHYPQVVKLT